MVSSLTPLKPQLRASFVVFLRYKVELDFLNSDSLNLSQLPSLPRLQYQMLTDHPG